MELKPDYNLLFAENQTLTTPRLRLRPVTLADAEAMYEYASDETTAQFVFPTHQSLADTRQSIVHYFMEQPFGKYGIESLAEEKLIGTMDLRVEEAFAIAELGYALNRAYWGQGIVPEACEALLELGFTKLQLARIIAKHDTKNPRSGRVMEKIGMIQENRMPLQRLAGDKVITENIYGITNVAWKERRQRQ